MKYDLLEIAFSGLLHDIGKFYQRTEMFSTLTEEEKRVTPLANAGYHTHLHSGYTSRFFRKYLKEYDEFERITSSHHLSETDELSQILKRADRIASAIDRKDEENDVEEKNKTGSFQMTRLSSVMSEIDFGKEREDAKFKLDSFSKEPYPINNYEIKPKQESVLEYKELWNQFIDALNNPDDQFFTNKVTKYSFDRLYALLYEYATYIPASTFEGNQTYVSLFDHLKLTSAVASCLGLNDSDSKEFVMLEFDVSGIQKFIFKVTEGKDTKTGIAKSLRGRSFLVSAITNCITYSYLHEFGLTQSNIIFNTGGGALLLLPKCTDYIERIEKISKTIQSSLLEIFKADISYVYAYVECDEKELDEFKIDKATKLKAMLEEEKTHKLHSAMEDSNFFYQSPDNKELCELCGSNFVENVGDLCDICDSILKLSDFFVKHEEMYLIYDYSHTFENKLSDSVCIDLHFMQLYLADVSSYKLFIKYGYDYIESINHSRLGNTRWISNLVPQRNGNILSFEDICTKLVSKDNGDLKLGILKMDVDNLGAIFAFGLNKTRSLSKYLTLSRLMESFFGYHLPHICVEVSKKIFPDITKYSDNEDMFYINYAGGDDLVIVGPIVGILELANQIDTKFKEYTHNQNITISGGITIMSPSKPIRFGIKEAEENLESSKNMEGKHSITLLDTTIQLDEFNTVLRKVQTYREYIMHSVISRTSFYNLMTILDIEEMDKLYPKIPIIMYSIQRNVTNETVKTEIKKDILTSNSIDAIKKLVLEMKLAIMQTRS